MNVLGTNLELFEYAGAERRSWDTPPGAAGSFFLILQTPTPERTISRLYHENAVVRPLDQPARGFEVVLPSGICLAVHHAPEQRLIGALALNRHDYYGLFPTLMQSEMLDRSRGNITVASGAAVVAFNAGIATGSAGGATLVHVLAQAPALTGAALLTLAAISLVLVQGSAARRMKATSLADASIS